MQPWRHPQPTGNAELDHDHRELVVLFDALLEAVNGRDDRRARCALAAVLARLRAHFRREEELMAQSGFPGAEQHRQAHALYLADVEKHQAELRRAGLGVRFRRWATGRLLEWARFHVTAMDSGLAAWLERGDAPLPLGPCTGREGALDEGPRLLKAASGPRRG